MVYYPYFPQNAIRVFESTPAQNAEDSRRLVTKQDVAEKLWAINNLPPEYHPSIYDKGHYLRDETWMEFVKWRMAGEKDQTVEYVKAPKSIGIMIPSAGRPHIANIAGTTINDSIIELNMRDVGKYLSLEHNFRQHLMDYIRSKEAQQLSTFLNKLGYKAEDIDYIAIGFVPEKAIYAIGRLPNGKVVVCAHKDSYKKIANEAEDFGMEAEELREVAIAEEIAHNFRKSYGKPRIMEERETKETLLEFYKTLSKTISNPKLQAKYARIIEHLEHDISTISRYAKIGSSSLDDLIDLYCADIGELISVLEGKALYGGINTKEGINEYVSEKLAEVAKAAEKEYSLEDRIADEEASEDGDSAEGAEVYAEAGAEVGRDSGQDGDGGVEGE